MRRIVILGSTGSIGTQTLDIVRERKDLEVIAMAAGSNIELLEKQIREFKPQFACVWQEEKAKELAINIKDTSVKVLTGMDGLIQCAVAERAEIVVTAIVGMIGIQPTIAAIKAKKDIALANKETLVTAGHIIMPLAVENGVRILPVDSEHSAIFQSLNGEDKKQVNKLLLTASGGPFRGKKSGELAEIKAEAALKHPNWSMGRKISIDSATMVNKGLEVMEAKWLFDVPFDKIEVVVQPQSVIHSMTEFVDGSIIAQLGTTDMRTAIQYALYYPERKPLSGARLDFPKLKQITFEEPDMDTFSGLKMAYEVGRMGGSMPTVYNAANEKAVAKFLNGDIKFLQILEIIRYAITNHKINHNPTVSEILVIEASTYDLIESRW